MEEETRGITFKSICKTIWLKKWVALIVAVAVALICVISLYYGYNAKARYYEIEFNLNLPNSNNNSVYTYPDGTQFNYVSLTSRDTLEKIKASSEDFADVDVVKMANKRYINIRRDVNIVADSTETASAIMEITYTISAKASYFSNESQAKDFLMKLTRNPLEYLSTMSIESGAYLPMAKAAIDYETEIGFLKNQLVALQDKYNDLIKTCGGSFIGNMETGKTLLAYSQEVKAYLDSSVLDNRLSELRQKHYIKSEECETYYINLQNTLERELKIKEKALNNVLKPQGTVSSVIIDVDESVLKMSQEIEELKTKLDAVKEYNEAKDNLNPNFLDDTYNKIEGLTDTYKSVCKNVYERASSVVYVQPSIVVETGEMGLITVALLSVVLGVIVGLVAAYVAGYLSLKNKNAVGEVPSEDAPQGQPEVEAEASEKENKE